MKNVSIKSRYNIKFDLKEVVTHDNSSIDKSEYAILIETGINKWKVEYFSNGQYIKGIIKTSSGGDVKIENRHNILSFSDTGELLRTRREGEEVLTNTIMGYFAYTRSINTIQYVGFNHFLNFTTKTKNIIYKNVVTLIENKLDRERFEALKKSRQ